MKKILTFLLCIFSVVSTMQAEEYTPFIEEGKVWTVGQYPMGEPHGTPFSLCRYYFEGDTIVGGRECKRWMKGGHLLAPIYEENKKVYFFMEGEESPRLLYDFGSKVGDTFTASHYGTDQTATCHVDSIFLDYCGLYVDGLHFYLIYDDIGDSSYKYVWLEGVGSLTAPENNCVGEGGYAGDIACVIDVRVGNRIIYNVPDANWGTNGVEAIDSGRRTMDNEAPTYDLSGRCISVPSVSSASSVLPKGVYIRNGRKVVMLE